MSGPRDIRLMQHRHRLETLRLTLTRVRGYCGDYEPAHEAVSLVEELQADIDNILSTPERSRKW